MISQNKYLLLYIKTEDLGGSKFFQNKTLQANNYLCLLLPCPLCHSWFSEFYELKHDLLFQSCSASALQARLKVAAHEAEEESDNIAEDFLEGKTEIDDFLSSFMEKRTVCNPPYLRTSDSLMLTYLGILMSKKTTFSTFIEVWSFECQERETEESIMIATSYYHF